MSIINGGLIYMEVNFSYNWLAGFIDGDGCFSLPMNLREKSNGKKWINITCQVRIALKANDVWVLEKIQKETGLGKIYFSNKGKPDAVASWQTTSWGDAIKITKLVLPHLVLKKEKAEKFLNASEMYINQMHPTGTANRHQGPLRTKKFLLDFAKLSTTINSDRQTKRYRDYKNFDYWKPIIERLYS